MERGHPCPQACRGRAHAGKDAPAPLTVATKKSGLAPPYCGILRNATRLPGISIPIKVLPPAKKV